jgi:hypothetical protein
MRKAAAGGLSRYHGPLRDSLERKLHRQLSLPWIANTFAQETIEVEQCRRKRAVRTTIRGPRGRCGSG